MWMSGANTVKHPSAVIVNIGMLGMPPEKPGPNYCLIIVIASMCTTSRCSTFCFNIQSKYFSFSGCDCQPTLALCPSCKNKTLIDQTCNPFVFSGVLLEEPSNVLRRTPQQFFLIRKRFTKKEKEISRGKIIYCLEGDYCFFNKSSSDSSSGCKANHRFISRHQF